MSMTVGNNYYFNFSQQYYKNNKFCILNRGFFHNFYYKLLPYSEEIIIILHGLDTTGFSRSRNNATVNWIDVCAFGLLT